MSLDFVRSYIKFPVFNFLMENYFLENMSWPFWRTRHSTSFGVLNLHFASNLYCWWFFKHLSIFDQKWHDIGSFKSVLLNKIKKFPKRCVWTKNWLSNTYTKFRVDNCNATDVIQGNRGGRIRPPCGRELTLWEVNPISCPVRGDESAPFMFFVCCSFVIEDTNFLRDHGRWMRWQEGSCPSQPRNWGQTYHFAPPPDLERALRKNCVENAKNSITPDIPL